MDKLSSRTEVSFYVQWWREELDRLCSCGNGNRVKETVLKAKAVRGIFNGSGHFAVVAKVKKIRI